MFVKLAMTRRQAIWLLGWMLCAVTCPLDGNGRLKMNALAATEPSDIFEANVRLGRGLNLGNYLEAPRGVDWGVQIEDTHFGLIKQAGFNSIRLPVRWSDYASNTAPYTIEVSFFERIDHLLEQASTAGLNVVLNIHHFEGLNREPEAYQEKFVALWRQIASRYQDRPEWLYFELNNEPHEALNDCWNSVLRLGLAAVRETNPTRPVIIGPVAWNSIRSLPLLDLPEDPRLIVTVHMYNPHEFTHQGASWVSDRVQSIRDLEWGTAEEMKDLERELRSAAEWGREQGRPIFVGEFGAYQSAPLSSRVKWTRAVARTAESHDMSWAYWEFAAGFGVFDPDRQVWRKPLLNALIPPDNLIPPEKPKP